MGENDYYSPHRRRRRRCRKWQNSFGCKDDLQNTLDVGKRLKTLRNEKGLSLRNLASISGLNPNTLSLIENAKTSPSVSTLQRLAIALGEPITAFFESDPNSSRVVFQKNTNRELVPFMDGRIGNLCSGSHEQPEQFLIVSLNPGMPEKQKLVVHTGHEFMFCLDGKITCVVDGETYLLETGDSIYFEAHLPHYWFNENVNPARFILALNPADENDLPLERHFPPETPSSEQDIDEEDHGKYSY